MLVFLYTIRRFETIRVYVYVCVIFLFTCVRMNSDIYENKHSISKSMVILFTYRAP